MLEALEFEIILMVLRLTEHLAAELGEGRDALLDVDQCDGNDEEEGDHEHAGAGRAGGNAAGAEIRGALIVLVAVGVAELVDGGEAVHPEEDVAEDEEHRPAAVAPRVPQEVLGVDDLAAREQRLARAADLGPGFLIVSARERHF
eukprot:CAMPEP_0118884314 /NCGR_PEP_ID=MMETSP1163-20130328/23180_1 /TAXON_ID=124430 /ORGANISM="Phaeomonas parva, Strain CCMP2877" /LENGTH=144 /DNA_ID=CAMNT_0006822035 /DNA_START=294 /DNA_END=728 /DNA_ORIENTATION=-